MADNDSVRQKKATSQVSTQLYLPFAEIRDNTVVLKNGGVRAILRTSSINFNLKSEAEQNAIIYSYQAFLNTLEFPIQILLKSKKLDIDSYLETLKGAAKKQQNPLLRQQTVEYAEYIKRLVEYADIMQKDFYVIVPYDPLRSQKTNIFSKMIDHLTPKDSLGKIRQRHKEFHDVKKGLTQRVNLIKAGLTQCGLSVEQLTTQEIIETLYRTYNPSTSRSQKLDDMDEINMGLA